MGALATFEKLLNDTIATGGGSKELNQKRADLFKNEVLPKLLKLGANKSTIQQAANVWNDRTQNMLMQAGMAPTQEQLDDADGAGSAAMNIARGRRREELRLAASAKKSGAGQTLDAAAHGLNAVVNRLQGGLQSGIAGTAGLLNGWVNKDANGIIDRNTALGQLEREARVLADESRRRGGAGLADHNTGTFAGDLWANTQDMAGSLAESSPSMALGGAAGKGAQLGLYALGRGKTAQLVGAGLAAGATEIPMNYEDAHSSQVADLNAVKRDGSYIIPNTALAAHVPVFNLVKQTELAKGVSEEDAEASARIAAIDQASHDSSVKGALMASVFSVIAPSAGSLAAARAVERQAAGKQMGRLGNYLANSARLGDNALTETRAAQAVAGQRYTGLGLSQLKPYGKLAAKEGTEEAAQQLGMNYSNEDKRAEVSGQAFRPDVLSKDLASSFVAGAVMGPTMGVATQGTQQMQDARQIREMAKRSDQLNAQIQREQARATAFDNQTMSQNWTPEQLAARQEQSQESAERLQKLGDALNRHVSTMRDLGLNPDGTLFRPTTRDQQQGVSAFQDAVDSINPVTPDAVPGTATPFNPTSSDIAAAFTQSSTNPSGAATGPTAPPANTQHLEAPQQTGLTGIANRAAASAESAIADPASVMPETIAPEAITQAPAAPSVLPDAPKGHAIKEVPVDQIHPSEDVPQFKSGANAEGVVEPLGGKFDRTGVAPIQLWRRTNGRLEVISGRHRLDLARRSGETTIPSQIHNEADGFTANHAGILDAEHNIRDGQGKVQDYVDYFKHTGLSQGTAESRGLLARATGQRAYSIATRGTDALIAGLRAGIISEKTATEIAEAAPNNEGLQAVGIKAVQDGKSGTLAVNLIHAVNAARQDKAPDDTTGDLFGFDDSAMRELEQMARYAGQRQQDISANLNAIRGAAKNPALAKKHGVDVNDPDGLNKKIAELTREKSRWAEWHKHPDLMAQVRGMVGQTGTQAPAPAPADTPDAGPDMFDLSPHSEQDVKDREDAQAAAEQKAKQQEDRQKAQDDADDFVLTGSDRKVDQLEARGQGSLLDFGGNAIDATPAATENGVREGDILTASGKPFANRNAANLQLHKRGLKDSHEVVELAPSQFVVRPRQQQAEDAASGSVEQEAPPTKDVATKPNQVSITQMPHPAGGGKQIWNVAVEGAIPDSAHEWAKETSRQMGGTTRSDMGWPGGYSFASNDLAKTFARRMSAKLRNVAKKEAAPDTASTVSDARQNVSVAEEAKAGSSTTIEPFEHVGLKIRPYRHRAGGEVKDGWLVQTPENAEREARGERQIGGDRILDSREAAIRAAEQMASLHQETKAFMARFAQEEQEAKAAEEARKESNRGKTLAERRADAVLDKPTNLPRSLGLGAGTRREAMQRAVEEGRLILEVMVQDTAAKKRDEAAVSRVHASAYMLGLSNPNIPIVKAGLEAQARLKENKYEKPEYRVYAGQSKDDNFVEISKTEYDYALRLKADIQHSKQPAKDAPAQTEAVKRAERRMANLRKQASGRKLTPGQRQRLEEKIKQAQQEKEAAESKPKSAASPDDVGSQWDALSTEEQRLLVRGRFSYDAASAVAGKKWGELSASGQKTVADAVDTATLLVRALTSGVVSPVEYPTAEAEKSFEHISQSPKSGAYAVRNAFLEAVQREYEAAAPLAETQEQKDALASAIDEFKAQYLQHDAAVMAARSNSYSGMVAGRDKLNVKQVAQRGNALDRQQDALQKWLNGATGSVKRAVIAARSPEQWAAEKQAKVDKVAKRQAQEEALIAQLLGFKSGDKVNFGGVNVIRVSKDRDGYPSSVFVDGTGLTDNKFDLAKTLFGGDTSKLREVVDTVRAKQTAETPKEDAPGEGGAAETKPDSTEKLTPTKSENPRRTLDSEGYVTDGQPIMPGDVFDTASGRQTTPYPKQKGEKYASQWIIDNAIAEAEARGDSYNKTLFSEMKPLKNGELTTADRLSALSYLFDSQALRKRLEEAAGEELKAVFDALDLAGARMSHSERVNALLAEDAQEVSDALDRVVADRKNPSPAPAKESATPAQKPVAKSPASNTPILDKHNSFMNDALRKGKATVAQYQAAFADLVADKEAILAELGTKTKAQLLDMGGHWFMVNNKNETKPKIINSLYRGMMQKFTIGRTFSYVMGELWEDVLQKMVDNTKQADLDDYAKEISARQAEYDQQRKQTIKALENPETYDEVFQKLRSDVSDGKTFKEAYLALTPEQRAVYDRGHAAQQERELAAQEQPKTAQYSGPTTQARIQQTKHTKYGHDLWVVTLADRLDRADYDKANADAKKLGGSYSSYRGGGAIPGFQFRTPEAAQAFADLMGGNKQTADQQMQDRQDALQDDGSQSGVERLKSIADRLQEKAGEILGASRNVNTARRARMAGYATAEGRKLEARAKTVRALIAQVEAGSANPYLSRIRANTQLEFLDNLVWIALRDHLSQSPKEFSGKNWSDAEAVPDTASYAEMPKYIMDVSEWTALANRLDDQPGATKMVQAIRKMAEDNIGDDYLKFAKDNLHKVLLAKQGGQEAAIFKGSRDDLERGLRRHPERDSVMLLQIKRGEFAVVLSPKAAKERGIWEGNPGKRLAVTGDFGAELVAKLKSLKIEVPHVLSYANDRMQQMQRLGIDTPAKLRDALREYIKLKAPVQEEDAVSRLQRELSAQGRQNDGLDFFPTAPAVIDQMLKTADLQPGMRVLEPSAGMGHIADRVRSEGVDPDVVEFSPKRRELLEAKGYNLVGRDFMYMSRKATPSVPRQDLVDIEQFREAVRGDVLWSVRSALFWFDRGDYKSASSLMARATRQAEFNEPALKKFGNIVERLRTAAEGQYDRILMNPPFSNRRDAEHVQHAYDLLKPGGRIVAIMGEGVFFGQDAKAKEFRDWLDSVGGTSEQLPEGSFQDPSLPVTTGVNARLVVIDKPADGAADSGIRYSRRAGGEAEARRQFAETEKALGGKPAYEQAKAAGKTKLNYGQWVQVRTPNFKAWFGDWENDPENASRAVDPETGEPIVVYHGTGADFSSFSTSAERLPWNKDGVGHYFTSSNTNAEGYGSAVVPVYLRTANPKQSDNFEHVNVTAGRAAELKRQGYDAIHFDGMYENASGRQVSGADEWVVFDPTQIKSAIGNSGEFSADNPDIRYSDSTSNQPTGLTTAKVRDILIKKIGKPALEALEKAGRLEVIQTFDPMKSAGDLMRSVMAWHGSPFKFDRFSLEHLGRGEGAQAYGWGLYFAGNREVAEWYRESLSAAKFDFEAFPADVLGYWNKYRSELMGLRVENGALVGSKKTVFRLRERAARAADKARVFEQYGDTEAQKAEGRKLRTEEDELLSLAEFIKSGAPLRLRPGRLYEVELAPEEDEYLLWDKPLSEQSEKVRDALESAGVIVDGKYGDRFGPTPMFPGATTFSGEAIYKRIVERQFGLKTEVTSVARKDSEKEASEFLSSLGIKGIKYLDGTSRDAGEGSHNYVVFDDNAVQILETYYSRVDDQPEGFYDPSTGKATLVADALTEATVIPTLLHELSGHAGFQGMMKPETYQAILAQVERMVDAGNPIAVRAQQRAAVESDDQTRKDELLPYLITEAQAQAQKRSPALQAVQRLIDRVIRAIKTWAAEKGFGPAIRSLTPDDIRVMAERMLYRMVKAEGQKAGEQKAGQQFSQMDSPRSAALSGIAFSEDLTASYAGQTNHTLTAKSKNGVAGVLEYVVYEGVPSISMVSVSEKNRRQGIGRALVQELQSKFPDIEIEWGMLTEDGAALRNSLQFEERPNIDVQRKQNQLEIAVAERSRLEAEANKRRDSDDYSAWIQTVSERWNELRDEIYELESDLAAAGPAVRRIVVASETQQSPASIDIKRSKASQQFSQLANTYLFDRSARTLGETYKKGETQHGNKSENGGSDRLQDGPENSATEISRRNASSAVDDLRSSKTVSGQRMSSDYDARQRTSLVGQQIKNPADLAILAQVYRDPRFETFRIFFVDKSRRVVAQMGLTSRLPTSAVAIIGDDTLGYLHQLADTAAQEGATGYYMLHNHPNGFATASEADKQITRTFTYGMLGLENHGHVVIDTNECSLISERGDATLHRMDFGAIPPPTYSEWSARKLLDPVDVMYMVKQLEVDTDAVTIINLNSDLRVQGITTVPSSAFSQKGDAAKNRRTLLRAALPQNGVRQVLVGHNRQLLESMAEFAVELVHILPDGTVEPLNGKVPGINDSLFKTEVMRKGRVTPDTSPAFDYLRNVALVAHKNAQALQAGVKANIADYATPDQQFTDTEQAYGGRDIRYSRRQGPQPFEELPEGRLYHAAQAAGRALSRLNTQYHLALQNPRFARVFNLIQAKLNHVVSETYACVQAAPDLLGRHDSFGDYLKLWSNVLHYKRNAQDHAAAAKALFDGTLIDQMVYTDQELRDIHQLSDTQIDLYRQARAAIDISLDQTVRGTILKIGLNAGMPFERVQALLDQDMSYQDAQGEVIRYLEDRVADATAELRNLQQIGASPMEISKAQKKEQQLEHSLEESRKRIAEIIKQRQYMEQTGYAPLMRFGKYWVNAYDDKGELAGHWRFESKRERDKAYNAMGREGVQVSAGEDNPDSYKLYQGVSPETVALFMQKSGLPLTDVEQEYFKLATANHSALRRKIHRKGYAGYSEDLSRVLSAFVLSNARYTVNQMYGSGSTGEIHAAVADTESTGGWQQRAQKLANYADDTQEELSWWRNVMFHINMGFSIGFGLVNLTQPFTQTLPFLTQERGEGAVKDLGYGLKVAVTSLAGKALPSQYQPLYLRAQKEGHLDPANVWQLQGRERGRSGVSHNFLSALSGASGSIAQVTETVNRRATFFAALKAAESMTPEQIAQYGSAYDYAVRAVQETQGIYNKGNRPMLSRGNVGSLFMMFKQYSIAYVEQLWRHFKHPKWRGEKDPFRRAFLLMLGLLWSIAGTMGLPFAQNIADLAQLVGAPLHGVHPERWLRDHLGRGLSDAIQYGPLNAFGLTDISGRTSMGNLVPGTKLLDPATYADGNLNAALDAAGNIGGPVGGFVSNIGKGLVALSSGDTKGVVTAVSPRAVGDAIKGVSAGITGDFKTGSRKTSITDVTPLEAAAKSLGLQPRRFTAAQRDQGELYQQITSQKRAELRFKNRYKEALQAHDAEEMRAIAKEIRQWNAENPDLRVEFKRADVIRAIREDRKPTLERMRAPKEIRKSAEYWRQ